MICPSNESSLVSTASDSHINCAKTRGGEIRVSNRVVCWKTKKNVNFEFFFSSSDFISAVWSLSRTFLSGSTVSRSSVRRLSSKSHTSRHERRPTEKRKKWATTNLLISGRVMKNYYFGEIVGGIQHDIQIFWENYSRCVDERWGGMDSKKKQFFCVSKKTKQHNPLTHLVCLAGRFSFFNFFRSTQQLLLLALMKKKRVSISTFCHLMNTSNKHFSPE